MSIRINDFMMLILIHYEYKVLESREWKELLYKLFSNNSVVFNKAMFIKWFNLKADTIFVSPVVS